MSEKPIVLPQPAEGEKGMLGRFGRYLEDFEVGDVYQHAHSMTINPSMHQLFCAITMTHNALHIDDHVAAATSVNGKNMVAGHFVYSLVIGQSVPDVSGVAMANLEINLKHPNPVFHGDSIYSSTEVLDVRKSKSKPDRGIVEVRTIAKNQHGEVVLELTRKVMIPKKPTQ